MVQKETEISLRNYKERVVAVLYDTDKSKVLLVKHEEKRKKGLYGFPGGEIRQNETMEAAVIRELAEETGVQAERENLLRIGGIYSGVINRDPNLGGERNYFLNAYIIKDFHGNIKPGKNTTPVWARIETLSRRRSRLMPSVEQIVFDGLQLIND